MLCSFTFTTTAANILCSFSMNNNVDSQQSQMDTMSDSCHNDKHQSKDNTKKTCCDDMHSCVASISLVSDPSLTKIQIAHSSVQLPANEHIVYRSSSPPTPPPKLIN